jgi:hypothetical protein
MGSMSMSMNAVRNVVFAIAVLVTCSASAEMQELRSTEFVPQAPQVGPAPSKCAYADDRCDRVAPWMQFFLGDLKFSASGGRTNKAGVTNALVSALPPATIEESWTWNVKFGYQSKPVI